MQQLRGPEPHTAARQQTLFSMGFSRRKRTLFDLQPGPLPQRHSAGFAEAMWRAAASVAGELQIISSKSEVAEDDDSGEGDKFLISTVPTDALVSRVRHP
jgi:hypothetical protein